MKQTDQGVKHLASPEQDFSVWPFRSGRFCLADSVWPIRSGRFGSAIWVWAVSVWPIRSDRFGLEIFRSDYEILQKFYINAKYLNQW